MKFYFQLKSIFQTLCTLGLFLLAACQNPDQAHELILDVEKPFGLSWETTRVKSKDDNYTCETQIDELSGIFSRREKVKLQDACYAEQFSEVYIQRRIQGVNPKDSGVRALLKGRRQIVGYQYFFDHDLLPNDESVKVKEARFTELSEKLTERYGPPTYNGTIDYSENGEVLLVEDGVHPCHYWDINAIFVELCAVKLKYIDGYELSLTYLDGNQFVPAKQLLGIIRNKAPGEAARQLGSQSSIENIEFPTTEAIKALSDWVANPETVCQSKILEPIEVVWSLSPALLQRAEAITKDRGGDELANFVFENTELISEDESEADTNKLIMYLLKRAADEGSGDAMNEIAASLIYCYQGVEQDLDAATGWLNQAVEHESSLARLNRAQLLLWRFGTEPDVRTLAKAELSQCAVQHPEDCKEISDAYQHVMEVIQPD